MWRAETPPGPGMAAPRALGRFAWAQRGGYLQRPTLRGKECLRSREEARQVEDPQAGESRTCLLCHGALQVGLTGSPPRMIVFGRGLLRAIDTHFGSRSILT